jgi:3-dehydroquinate dehydratase II
MQISIIHGPNLNLLGTRETAIYGDLGLMDLKNLLEKKYPEHQFLFFQSNHEGEIIDVIHQSLTNKNPIIINPGGYAHTSVAIHDALKCITHPKIEVHLSHLFQRESFRQQTITAAACDGMISGLHFTGYLLAVAAIEELLSKSTDSAI